MRFLGLFLACTLWASAAAAQEAPSFFGFRLGMTPEEARAASPRDLWFAAPPDETLQPGEVRLVSARVEPIGGLNFGMGLLFKDGRLESIAMFTGGQRSAEACTAALYEVAVGLEQFAVLDGAATLRERLGVPTVRATPRGSQVRTYRSERFGERSFANHRGDTAITAHSSFDEFPGADGPVCIILVEIGGASEDTPIVELEPPPTAEDLARGVTDFEGPSDWAERPDGRTFALHYPFAALDAGIGGRVTLDCLVREDRKLWCAVVSEEPEGMGFGDAARAIARAFRMADKIGERDTVNMRVRVPIRFNVME